MHDIIFCEFKNLPDIIDWHGENRIANRNFHTIHNRHSQRDFECGRHPFAAFAGNGDAAADIFHIALDNVHANAAPGILSDFDIGGESRHQQEIQDILMGIFHARLCQALPHCFI